MTAIPAYAKRPAMPSGRSGAERKREGTSAAGPGSYFISDEDAEEKEGARDADEGGQEVERFPGQRVICFSDRTEINEEAEAESEEKKEGFDHKAMISQPFHACQQAVCMPYQDFLFDSLSALN